MWTNWVTIHKSFGLPRMAQECRTYLEQHGVATRIRLINKDGLASYILQVPQEKAKPARELLSQFKQRM